MIALIFGANGQDGYYLSKKLLSQGIEVVGVSRQTNKWIRGDVSDYHFVENLIKGIKPDYIFHLAANSTTRHNVLFENHETISTGTLNILESAFKYSPKSKIFLSGSGLQFVNQGSPIFEKDEFEASSPYCISRIQSVYAARYYRNLGLKVYVGYFFNHDSPIRSERHVNKKIVLAAKKIAGGNHDKFTLGNVSVKKEFTYAQDSVEAIWILIENEDIFEAIIGSGKAYSIENWLDECFGYFNLDWKPYVTEEPTFKTEYEILVSNPLTLLSLGWKQKVGFSELARIMIEHAE
jgi:GDPmannose 4,6-dehydratase